MNDTLPYDSQQLRHLAGELITNIRELGHAGWTPATSSNFSMRLDDKHAAITVSGRNKTKLTEADIMAVDFNGVPVGNDLRPSAETLLHTQLYKRFPEIGCVLHTHSINQTVASRLFAADGKVRFEGYELQKAFHGNTTHDDVMEVPVYPNTQDMTELAAQVESSLDKQSLWGYLIDGHGLYAWGRDMAEARRHLEAFEFLLACELKMREVRR
ncbi:methylthioribulose 1-phosphate dehydratase [Lysobacter soyae]|uniref:Methylthioribulose-1-phosphate dehydratase n=1 Tax=Lysobacter soyae TaxID=2764185 RepID=A0ABX8WKW7_9GAMM|nr:methylthioribulose 1-phosphate dehydratase [Lysobacter sp. CJ11]QYR52272.1 methylthioribulose 1-phosphate dehydratase [Lysobacter sp. CJ11]